MVSLRAGRANNFSHPNSICSVKIHKTNYKTWPTVWNEEIEKYAENITISKEPFWHIYIKHSGVFPQGKAGATFHGHTPAAKPH